MRKSKKVKKTFPSLKYKWIIISALILLVALEISILYSKRPILLGAIKQRGQEKSLQEYAEAVLEKCSQARYRPACYDEEVPLLTEFISLEEAFEVTRLIQEKDGGYLYCHVLGHNLSAKETKKDPDKWKEVIARCPSGLCSNGCIHGAFQERFRADSLPDAEIAQLRPELEGICEKRPGWNPTDLEQATCYHALGHLSMYMTAANIERSSTLCEELSVKPDGRDYTQICYDGVFMQIFQPLEPEDFALVEGLTPKKEELKDFCSSYEGRAKGSCWSEGWPLYFEDLKKPQNLVEFCSYLGADPGEEDRCYLALFYVLTAQFSFDEEKINDYCLGLSGKRRGQCFANAASRMIETDWSLIGKSVSLCSTADELGVGEACYEELLLYSTYNFHPGSEEFYNLCNSLPESWKTRCLDKV